MIGEHPGKAGGIGSDAPLQEEEDGPPPAWREWREMEAYWCSTLGLVFQLCWHICVTAAEMFTLRWLAGFSHYLWPKAMVECIQRIHKPSFISLKPTVILESVWITHDNNQKLLIWLLLFRESTLWPIIYIQVPVWVLKIQLWPQGAKYTSTLLSCKFHGWKRGDGVLTQIIREADV